MATTSRIRRPAVKLLSATVLATLGVLALVWLSIKPAQAVDHRPAACFHGKATIEGKGVPVGTTVAAYVRGVKVQETYTFDIDGNSVYSIDISADDASTEAIDGAREDDLVVFHISDRRADKSAFWHAGTVQYLDIDGQPNDAPSATIAAR